MKLLCVLFPTIGLLTAFSVSAWSDDRVLRADTMVGVDGPFVGTANPIRGVAAESVMEGDSSGVGAINLPFLLLLGMAALWARRRRQH